MQNRILLVVIYRLQFTLIMPIFPAQGIFVEYFADFYPYLAAGERRGSSRASDDAEGITITK